MYLSDVPAPTILDNLIAAQKIRPMIAVLVGNVNRDRELTPNPEFADFIEHELIPWVRANYRVSRDPRRVVIGGSSFGGLAAAYIAMRSADLRPRDQFVWRVLVGARSQPRRSRECWHRAKLGGQGISPQSRASSSILDGGRDV